MSARRRQPVETSVCFGKVTSSRSTFPAGTLNVQVSDEELRAPRRAEYVPQEPKVKNGWLYRYSKMVGPSCKGAVMMED